MVSSFGSPFDALFALQRALEANLTSDWLGAGTAGPGAFPPINVFQKGDDFVAVVELPGVDKESVEIEAKENTIRIAGRKTIKYDESASVHRRERVTGSFDRTIAVPIQIDPDAIRAEMRDGVLALFIARAQRDKPRKIAIG
ncbi:MAG TPA: Hsp20/alpha crystallin family protein [Xanthobacteraceae bacterium]|nr:Hsp20/alpha crystallin family protein [Xanthobacteraceae bacterium]